jgi:membrane-associated protease RseP (regulator of RpoE activity)
MLLVRLASALAPLGVSMALFFMALLLNGTPRATTGLEVLEGAARDAGMRDGDRVVKFGGERIADFEQLRAEVQHSHGPTPIEIERGGQKLELLVTPRNGRIGVAPLYDRAAVSVGTAASHAISWPFQVVFAGA